MALAVAGAIALVPAPATAQAPAQPGDALTQIVPGQSMAAIALGDRIERVLTRFGTPSEVRDTGREQVFVFGRFGISVYSRDGAVVAASTTNSLLRTTNGLTIGSPVEDVTRAHGAGGAEVLVEGLRGLAYPLRGIAFGLDRASIAVILVFRPQATVEAPGLQAAPPAPVAPRYPDMSGVQPFRPESNYMSLAGYLRWLVFQEVNAWITVAEAARILREQLATKR